MYVSRFQSLNPHFVVDLMVGHSKKLSNFAETTIYCRMSNIGENIRTRRKFLKITQEELADIAGVGVNTLIKLERGEGNPTLAVIEKVLDVLGLELCTTIKKNEP